MISLIPGKTIRKAHWLCLVALILFNACKKDVVEVDSNYEGIWYSSTDTFPSGVMVYDYFFIEGGSGVFGEDCDPTLPGNQCGRYFKGDAKINRRQSKIKIGEPFTPEGAIILRIDVPAHINSDGKWECTMTESVYIKQ